MTKKKVLIFIDWYLPGFKAGGPIRSVFNIVKAFSKEFDFFIVTSDRDFGDEHPYPSIQIDQWVELDDSKVIYLSSKNQNRIEYKRIINEIDPEIVYFNSLFSSKFTIKPLQILKKLNKEIKIILAPRGMLGKGALSIKPIKKSVFIKWARWTGLFKNVVWHASTIHEKLEIESNFGKRSAVKIAENLAMLPENISSRSNKKEANKLSILFVSRISEKKNLKFLLSSIAEIARKKDVSLKVVGPIEDKQYFEDCEDYGKRNDLSIEFLDSMPNENLSQVYLNSDVFCLPTLHENYGHVIIEAMSFGLPVIISKKTPWLNLEEKNVGFDLDLISSSFAEKINLFLELNDESYSHMSANALKYASHVILNENNIEANRELFQKG